jgi:hypothetical protein
LGIQETAPKQYAYQYTTAAALGKMITSGYLNPSLLANNPKDARLGNSVYLTTIDPLSEGITRGIIARALFGRPFPTNKVERFLTVRIDGMAYTRVGKTVFVPSEVPVYIRDRIAGYGATLP